jgi:hypothetical protein
MEIVTVAWVPYGYPVPALTFDHVFSVFLRYIDYDMHGLLRNNACTVIARINIQTLMKTKWRYLKPLSNLINFLNSTVFNARNTKSTISKLKHVV